MEKLIQSIIEQHKNKRIKIIDIDKELKNHGINLFVNPEYKKLFTHVIRELIHNSVLIPLKNSTELQQYGRLPDKYEIDKAYFKSTDKALPSECLHELMSLFSKIDINYYTKHVEEYYKHRDAILRINDLVLQEDCKVLTANERSYLLFGDEKAITAPKDATINGNEILKKLGLTLSDIKAKRVFEPFFYSEKNFRDLRGISERTVLIIENKDTFWTFQEAVLSSELDEIHLIIYGEGNAIQKKFEYIQIVGGETTDHYYYFGDIDKEGILIYNQLRDRYLDYDIRPAVSLYEYALNKAGLSNAKPLRKSRTIKFSLSPFIDFFENETGEMIEKIILDNRYIPQEVINKTDLRRLNEIGLY